MRRHIACAAAAALVVAGLTGCAGSADEAGSRIRVVASTNVYGSIASVIGGDLVQVTSIIDGYNKDPHDYQASARDQLALSRAALIIENGAGYDDFVDTLLSSAGNPDAIVLTAATVAGNTVDAEANEHVWYDLAAMDQLAQQITAALTREAPLEAGHFDANSRVLRDGIAALEKRVAELRGQIGGEPVAATEPLPSYLLQAVGLLDRTPPQFSRAVEEGRDAAPSALRQVLALFTARRIAAVVYNKQAEGPQLDQVLQAAQRNSIPAIGMTELLPPGETYLSWMSANLDALAAALKGTRDA